MWYGKIFTFLAKLIAIRNKLIAVNGQIWNKKSSHPVTLTSAACHNWSLFQDEEDDDEDDDDLILDHSKSTGDGDSANLGQSQNDPFGGYFAARLPYRM